MVNASESVSLTKNDVSLADQTQAKTEVEFDQAAQDVIMNAATKVAQGILQPMLIQNLNETFKD